MNISIPTSSFRTNTLSALVLLVLLLSGCAGVPFGNPTDDRRSDRYPAPERIEGVVESVDIRDQMVLVTADRRSPIAPGQRVNLGYDDGTTVSYQEQSFRVQDLEPGDRIVADVVQTGRMLMLDNIVVTADISPDDRGVINDTAYDLAGTITRIDARNNTLTLDPYGRETNVLVSFDRRSRAYLDDRSIAISDLRTNDYVEIELVRGSRQALVDTITVVETAYEPRPESNTGTLRGEVLSVDNRRRELVISTQDSLISGFVAGNNKTVTLLFSSSLMVEYDGNSYTPDNLERGDGVEVEYVRENGDLWAERVYVISNVRN